MDFDLGTTNEKREVAKPEIGLFIFAVENFLHFRGI